MTLGVIISDIYDTAKIKINVETLSKEAILEEIEKNYADVRKQINGRMGGTVVVYEPTFAEYYGKEVARGNILYFGIPAGHRIDLKMV